MNKGANLGTALALILLIAPLLIGVIPAVGQAIPNGSYPDKLILFLQPSEDAVIPMIENNEMDSWLYYVRNQLNIQKAVDSPNIDVLKTFASSDQLLINPLVTETGFNPFSIREVREALNWLIDRNYIVNEIMKGDGVARWTEHRAVSPDYARVIDAMKILEAKYQYDFEKAKSQIFDALTDAGATLKQGKWYYDDAPISIIFLIRPEDERKDIGDYVADQLDLLGLTVVRDYKPSAQAYRLWGAMGPTKRGEWHIYTGGWAHTAITAYLDDDPWFMYSADNCPLFEEFDAPPLLREAMDKLNNGDYKSQDDRNELIKRINDIWLQDGVHIWIIDLYRTYASSSKLGTNAYDLYGGLQNLWALRTMRFASGTGGDLRLGVRSIFIEGFNPAAGFSWLYDVYCQWLVSDVSVYPHPHTGLYVPLRTDYTVQTAGPDGKLSVPTDALIYDITTRSFVPVGSGVDSKSKISVTFTWGKWHDGQSITEDDFFYTIAEVIRLCTPTSDIYDAVAASPFRTNFKNFFRGVKMTGPDTADIYLDYWHVDSSYIAYAAIYPIFPDAPWQSIEVGNKLVAEKESAWSIDQADALGVEMLDLTKGPSLALIKTAYDTLSAANAIPTELASMVTASEAQARWKALGDWYAAKGHWWVSNGPYMFGRADTTANQIVLDAFRDYPFKADKWDALLTVRIPDVKIAQAPTEVVPGLDATVKLTSTVAGKPYEKTSIKYLLTDPKGALAASGTATKGTGANFTILINKNVTANLATGTHTMTIIGVGEEAALPSTQKTSFAVIPVLAYYEKLVSATKAELTSKLATVEQTSGATKTSVDNLAASFASMQNTTNMAIGIAAVSFIIAAVSVVMALRKRS